VCNGEALQTICSRIEPAINTALQHVPLGAEMAAKDLKRHIFSTLQVMIETQVRKEIEAWIRRTLKGLEPLRKVITGKIHRLINALYALSLFSTRLLLLLLSTQLSHNASFFFVGCVFMHPFVQHAPPVTHAQISEAGVGALRGPVEHVLQHDGAVAEAGS
jgi:hypothetical protein